MEKFSYNSYPDSNDSSPRSREIEFDNPPPWDDQQNQLPQSYKVKFMCSYGGKILPRSHDNHLTYVNGETKILSVDRSIRFPVLASKLAAVCGGDGAGDVSFKYQLPGEDLDALISVTNDDDLEHMMHEYDRLVRTSSKPARLRLFLFPVSSASGGFGSEGSAQSDRDRFVEALNTVPNRNESEKSVTAPPNNPDFMFISEKIAAPPLSLPEAKLPLPSPSTAPVALEPPLFNDQRVIQPDQGANPVEVHRIMHDFQRMQIRDQDQHHQQQLKQQQETVYIRKNEDGFMETGAYLPPSYTQPPPPTIPQTNQQPPPPFWNGNHNPRASIFPKTTPLLPEQQPLYMIPSPSPSPHPGGLYHAPPPPPPQAAVMRPLPTGQSNQGYYPAPVQRLAPPDTYREQQYTLNHTQPPPPLTQTQPLPPLTSVPLPPLTSVPLPPQYSAVPPPRQVITTGPMSLPDTSAYNYTGGIGKQLYYTETGAGGMILPPPQYHGIGLPVTGPDGKVIAINNRTPKVSSQSSDSAV